MDWFFAINESSAAFGTYTQLAKVAVHTALMHTARRPRMLYDGSENAFTSWMRRRGVDIIFAESYLKNDLPKLSGLVTPGYLTLLPGVFLRMELPRLGLRLKTEDRVLYTDCDVMFRRDVTVELHHLRCAYFAVAGEFEPDDYYNMNTGVMLMNLTRLREVDPEFRAYVRCVPPIFRLGTQRVALGLVPPTMNGSRTGATLPVLVLYTSTARSRMTASGRNPSCFISLAEITRSSHASGCRCWKRQAESFNWGAADSARKGLQ